MKKLAFLLILILVSISVIGQKSNNQKKEILIQSFPIEKELSGYNIDIPISTKYMGVVDSLLIIVTRDNRYKIHIYNTEDMTLVKKVGREGKGPGEFVGGVKYFNQYEIDNDDINIWIFDVTTRKFQLINLTSLLSKRPKPPKQSISIDRTTNFEFGIFSISENYIVGTSSSNKESYYWKKRENVLKGHFFRRDLRDGSIEWTVPRPELSFKYRSQCGVIYQDFPGMKPDKSKIAAANKYFSKIDVYKGSGELDFSIKIPSEKMNLVLPNSSDWFKENHQYYGSCSVSDDYIYALYKNTSFDAFYESDFEPEIHVFDWDGNPICRYRLKIPLDHIAVDEKTRTIFGGHDVTDGGITVFKMGDELSFHHH